MINPKIQSSTGNRVFKLDARPASNGKWLEYIFSNGQELNPRRFQVTGKFKKEIKIPKWYNNYPETPTLNDLILGVSFKEA
jgi:hypothetical protein